MPAVGWWTSIVGRFWRPEGPTHANPFPNLLQSVCLLPSFWFVCSISFCQWLQMKPVIFIPYEKFDDNFYILKSTIDQ